MSCGFGMAGSYATGCIPPHRHEAAREYSSAWDRWVAQHGPGPHFVICGRDRAKLGAFWRHSFQIARCGNHNGAVVNPDSGRPIVFDDERLLRDDFGRHERFAETLESVALCGGERTKPRRPLTVRCGRLMAPESGATLRLSSLAATCLISSNSASPTRCTRQKQPTPHRETRLARWQCRRQDDHADRHADGRHGLRRIQCPVPHRSEPNGRPGL